MKSFQKRWLATFLVAASIVVAAPAMAADAKADPKKPAEAAKASSGELVVRAWTQRCVEPKADEKTGQKAGKKQCAIFERIDVKDSSLRVAEFAVGFSDDKEKEKGNAIGKIDLPLGILLEPGVAMKIEDGKPLVFKPSFCTNEGCTTYVSLDKDILNSMKKAKKISFQFKTADGRNASLVMSLEGFEKAMKDLE